MNPIITPDCQELQHENENLRKDLQGALDQIQAWITELKHRNFEYDMINRMGYSLQHCQNIEELGNLIGQYAYRLFMERPGELFLINEDKQILEKASSWGDIHQDPVLLRKEYCRSLSSNQLCSYHEGSAPNCQYHATLAQGTDRQNSYVCAPITYRERVIGVLHQHLPEISPILHENQWISMEHWDHLACNVADLLTSTYTNLKLCERLRPQNLRDPLTQLFNQWFMEETLEREISYAKRHQTPLWIYKMDVDRMKNFNDRHGHDVGDEVLRRMSAYVKCHIRAEDLACRSGGDEFTLILLGMEDDSAKIRADRLREGMHDLRVKTYDLLSVSTTISFGLASFPHHGESTSDLLRAADKALRQAKSNGRDTVVVA